MASRVPLYLAGAAAVALGAWIVLGTGDGDAKPNKQATSTARPTPPRPVAGAPRELPSSGSAEVPRKNREWTVPGQTAVFVEQLEAVENKAQEAADRLTYKKHRLRFKLSDAAAECYDGGEDSKADIQVGYTLIVEGEVLRVENVKMLDSTLPDPALEKCIVQQIKDLTAPAVDLPDMREEQTHWISLHDLYVRNRPKDNGAAPADPTPAGSNGPE